MASVRILTPRVAGRAGVIVSLLVLACQDDVEAVANAASDADVANDDANEESEPESCRLSCGSDILDLSTEFPGVILGYECTGTGFLSMSVSAFPEGACVTGPTGDELVVDRSEEYSAWFAHTATDVLDAVTDQPTWFYGPDHYNRSGGLHAIDGQTVSQGVLTELCLQRDGDRWQGSWCIELENGETRGGLFSDASVCLPCCCW